MIFHILVSINHEKYIKTFQRYYVNAYYVNKSQIYGQHLKRGHFIHLVHVVKENCGSEYCRNVMTQYFTVNKINTVSMSNILES